MLRRVLRDSARAPAGAVPTTTRTLTCHAKLTNPAELPDTKRLIPLTKGKSSVWPGRAAGRQRAPRSRVSPGAAHARRAEAAADRGAGLGERGLPARHLRPTLASSQPPPFGFSATPLTPHSSPGSWEGLGLRCPSHSMSVGGTVSQTHSRRSVTQRPRPPTGRWRFRVNAQNSETHLGKTGRPREWRARTVSL